MTKKVDQFYVDVRGLYGRTARCKQCLKLKQRAIYWKDPEKSRAVDRLRSLRPQRRRQLQASLRRQRAADPEKFNRRSREWAGQNPEKRRAHLVVARAVKSGSIVRGSCEGCGRKRGVQAHHDDYEKPLDVRWLCTRCRGLVHRAANETRRAG